MDPDDPALAEVFAADRGARMLAAFHTLPNRDVAMHRMAQREAAELAATEGRGSAHNSR